MSLSCIEDKIGQIITGCRFQCNISGLEKLLYVCDCNGCKNKPTFLLIVGLIALAVSVASYLGMKLIRKGWKKK